MIDTTASSAAGDDLVRPSYHREPDAPVPPAHAGDRAAGAVTSRRRGRSSVADTPARGSQGKARR